MTVGPLRAEIEAVRMPGFGVGLAITWAFGELSFNVEIGPWMVRASLSRRSR